MVVVHPMSQKRDMGYPGLWRFTHLSDDEAVAKMGHPDLWWSDPIMTMMLS